MSPPLFTSGVTAHPATVPAANFQRPAAPAAPAQRPQPAEPELSPDDQQQAQLLMQVCLFLNLAQTLLSIVYEQKRLSM